MYVQLAPIRLKQDVDEATFLRASDEFQSFVDRQKGIIKRLLLKSGGRSYADLVFFETKADADRVAEIEQTSQECLEFLKVMEPPDPKLPDMGVLSFEHLKTYERR